MWAIGGRIVGSFVVLLVVSIVLFVLVHTIPVSPARVVLGIDASEADIAEFDRDHGLDKPLVEQYAAWIGGALRGDFGKSVIDDTSISPKPRSIWRNPNTPQMPNSSCSSPRRPTCSTRRTPPW